MDILGPVQTFVLLVLAIGAFVLTGFAAVDALRRRGPLFPQVGRLTKPVWLGILVVAFLISILSLPGGYLSALSFLNVYAKLERERLQGKKDKG